MTKSFEAWYEKYVKQCDKKYLLYVEYLTEKLHETKEQAQKIVNVRMQSDMSQESELDEKISASHDGIYKLEAQLKNVKRIKEGMDSSKLKLTAEKVYNKLVKHPSIVKIEISKETNLNVYTKKLTVKKQKIGNYKLTLNLSGTFYIRNLEYVVNGTFDHWHVQLGEPCLASWQPILAKQIDTYQLFLFVDTLIHYLLLSNDTHSYMTFNDWISKFKTKEKVKKLRIVEREFNASISQLEYLTMYVDEATTEGNIVVGVDPGASSDSAAGWSNKYTRSSNLTTVTTGWTSWSTGTTS